MALEPSFTLAIQSASAHFRVTRVTGEERVHAPFRLTIVVDSRTSNEGIERAPLDVEALIGLPAELTFAHEAAPRTVHGLVDRIEEVEAGYRIVLVPRAAPLADAVDHRVFLAKDAVEIAKSVLEEQALDVETRVTRAPAKRPQCVQAFEDNLGFVSRLLSEEGILWHVEHNSGKDVIVFSDHDAAYPPIEGGDEIPHGAGEAAGMVSTESIYRAELCRTATHTKVTLCDYDFERPLVDQTAAEGDRTLERFEFPGGYVDPAVGKALAKLRLEEAKGQELVLRGATTCRRLSPGSTFTLTGAPRDDMNQRWLVLEVSHDGADFGSAASATDRRYEAEFVAVSGAAAYRPERAAPPTLGGVQTATVTGPSGAEIHTEAHGRVTALLRWDRLRKADETSSHWLRPIQPPTSGGFFLPRMGWEVLLGFSGTSGDMPYEIGRLYNGQAPPPEGLPGQKVRTAFGTLTTPGGGSANLVRTDDAAGSEGLLINASRDYNERTENDKGITVKIDDIHSVGSNHTHIVGILSGVTVTNSQKYDVGASRDVTTTGNLTIAAASEKVAVGGLRIFQVGGDYETTAGSMKRAVVGAKAEVAIQEVNRHVTGVSTVLVGGGWTEVGGLSAATSVLGASTLVVAGPMSVDAKDYSLKASSLKEEYASRKIKAGGKRNESIGGPAKYSIGGSLTMKGSNVFFKADSKLTIKAGGVTITITPSAVKIKGAFDSSEASIVTGDETND